MLLFVVLGGVFAMHALDSHGVAGNHTVEMTHHASTGASAIRDASRMSATDEGRSSADVLMSSDASSLQAPADDSSSAMALCVGVLVASVLLLLVRRALGLQLIGLAPRWPGVALSTIRGRDRDPPSLALLSVCRC